MNLFSRLKDGLARTRESLTRQMGGLGIGNNLIGEAALEAMEEALIGADTGVETAVKLTEVLRQEIKAGRIKSTGDLQAGMKEQIRQILVRQRREADLSRLEGQPLVILVVGVNGVGKTTTIAKLAHLHKARGAQVLLAAGDTFRAAAIEQLEIWGNRAGVPVVRHQDGADPAAVVYDALQAARARGMEVVIVDTAGRLHTKVNLMEELKKIKRVIGREIPGAPQETLLVLDANTGQNAISQARLFDAAMDISGIVLTKLDGTAKGGIVIAIQDLLQIPIKYIGIGESIDDLQPFDPDDFVAAIFTAN